VDSILQPISDDNSNPWQFVDLYTDGKVVLKTSYIASEQTYKRNMSNWPESKVWQKAMKELDKDRPHLLIHQHNLNSGFGRYLLPQMQELNETLQRKGCRLMPVTLLRDPLRRCDSHMHYKNHFLNIVRKTERNSDISAHAHSFANISADYQVRYILYGNDLNEMEEASTPSRPGVPTYFTTVTVQKYGGSATAEVAQEAVDILSRFAEVGRTENMEDFGNQINKLLGLQKPLVIEKSNTISVRHFETPPDFADYQCPLLKQDEMLYHHFFPNSTTKCDSWAAARTGEVSNADAS
jgi:hypothetical protein